MEFLTEKITPKDIGKRDSLSGKTIERLLRKIRRLKLFCKEDTRSDSQKIYTASRLAIETF